MTRNDFWAVLAELRQRALDETFPLLDRLEAAVLRLQMFIDEGREDE